MSDTPFEQTEIEKQEETPLKPLIPKRVAFVREYLKDRNGTKAAIRAGYSVNSAAAAGCALLTIPEVAAAVAKASEERALRAGMTAEHVLQEMALLADSSIEHYTVDDFGYVKPAPGAPDGVMRAVQSVKRSVTVAKDGVTTYHTELRLWGKSEPLKLMGRETGIFSERVEHTGKGGGPIETVTKIERVIVDPVKE